jgi:hypothetical protein
MRVNNDIPINDNLIDKMIYKREILMKGSEKKKNEKVNKDGLI